MHPILMGELARLRHEQLIEEADAVRRARSAGRGPGTDSRLRARVRTAIGNRLVVTGWRLLEAGLPPAQAVAPVSLPRAGD
jgi:hypothetical protein